MKRVRYRSLVGTIAILMLMAVVAALVLLLAERLTRASWLVQLVFYAVAGMIWVVPAAYVTRWMQAEGMQAEGSADGPVSAASSGPEGSSARRSGRSP